MAHDDDLEHPHSGDIGRSIRWAIGLLLVAALVAFAVDNRQDVRVGWVFGDKDAPIWLVVMIAAAAGAVIGWIFTHRPRRRD